MTKEEYNDKCREYAEKFGLGYTGQNIEKKFVLLGLICYMTNNARKKHPETTCLQVVQALRKNFFIADDLQERIAVMAEDFMYGCNEFSTFGIKPSDIMSTLKSIIDDMLPF